MNVNDQKDAFLTSPLGDIPVTTDGTRYLIDAISIILHSLNSNTAALVKKSLVEKRKDYNLD